jgi:hypothetical protein
METAKAWAALSAAKLNEAGRVVLLAGEEDVISQGQVCNDTVPARSIG